MAGTIFLATFGDGNYYWQNCLADECAAVILDKPYFDLWKAGDQDGFVEAVLEGHPADLDRKSAATMWWRRAGRVAESEGDVWIHTDGADLWWTETLSGEPYFREHEFPADGTLAVAICKKARKWSNRNSKTERLQWRAIHPRARDFLTSQLSVAAMRDGDNIAYVQALLAGGDLEPWHGRDAWRERLGAEKGRTLARGVPVAEFALVRMTVDIVNRVKHANGQQVLSKVKDKQLLCTPEVLRAHLAELVERQGRACALTGLEMHFDGEDGIEGDMLVSVDRIDSDGHYAPGNLQLVCRFANFWKAAQPNGRFLELIARVRAVKDEVTAPAA